MLDGIYKKTRRPRQGGIQNKHSSGVQFSPPPLRLCLSVHPEGYQMPVTNYLKQIRRALKVQRLSDERS